MRIAFIVGLFPVLSETFILNQAIGMLARGHEVDIYTVRLLDSSKIHPSIIKYRLLERTYELEPVPRSYRKRLWRALVLLKQRFFKNPSLFAQSLNVFRHGRQAASLRLFLTAASLPDKQYDIVHCQFGGQGNLGIMFTKLLHPRPKLVVTFRGSDISKVVQQSGEKVYRNLFKVGDFFMANCEFFRKRAIELGCDARKIIVHGSGLDCERFFFTPRRFPHDGCIKIVTTGRLVEKKGIEYSIRAVAQQAQIYPNLEYKIIGDGPLKVELQELIEQLNVSQIVQLLGWKNEEEIIQILSQAHLFIAPSVTANDGDQDAPINVLKEAMAMGLPVISTYHGGIPELVEDGVSGFLVPERDAGAIAHKLNDLIEHPEIWESMGRAGRNYVDKHYNIKKLNDKLEAIYQQLVLTG